jgi:hypothetical protein
MEYTHLTTDIVAVIIGLVLVIAVIRDYRRS